MRQPVVLYAEDACCLYLSFNAIATKDKVDVDTSAMSSVDLERARHFASVSLYDNLGGDNPSPKERALRDFFKEMEETACGGPRTGDQFVQMIKHMPKAFAGCDLDVILSMAGKAPVAGG